MDQFYFWMKKNLIRLHVLHLNQQSSWLWWKNILSDVLTLWTGTRWWWLSEVALDWFQFWCWFSASFRHSYVEHKTASSHRKWASAEFTIQTKYYVTVRNSFDYFYVAIIFDCIFRTFLVLIRNGFLFTTALPYCHWMSNVKCVIRKRLASKWFNWIEMKRLD